MCADFDAALFQQNLKTKVLGRMLTYRASVESTMDVLQKEVRPRWMKESVLFVVFERLVNEMVR
jgi:hypothetical protein